MRKRGFTLIELLVVIAIIGILATLMLMGYRTVRQKARDTQRKTNMRTFASGAEVYYDSMSPTHYPQIGDAITATTTIAAADTVANVVTAMQYAQALSGSAPSDPGQARRYYTDSYADGFVCAGAAAATTPYDCTAAANKITVNGAVTLAATLTDSGTATLPSIISTAAATAQEAAFCQALENPNTQATCTKTAQ